MHFPIIILENPETDVDNWQTVLDGDACIESHTDYTGDLYNEQERKDAINSPWFSGMLDGFATLDTEKETITFFDQEKCKRRFNDYMEYVTGNLYKLAQEHKLNVYDLKDAGDFYKDYWFLFVVESFAETSFEFIYNAQWRAGKTYRIGNIFDAHV